jgi:aspartyl protease family protein
MKIIVTKSFRLAGLLLIAAALLLSHAVNAQETDIEVVALFKNAAMLKIDGIRRLLKTGEKSPEGITLEEADSETATIKYDGNSVVLGLSQRISTRYEEPGLATVSVQINQQGQYITTGSINGSPVKFLVDTGANIVAMNTKTASGLGIDTSTGRKMRVTTAGGTIASTEVYLGMIQVGEIAISNVQAVVLEGEFPTEVLLGMSFLRKVKIEENAGLMMLTAEFQ